MWEIYTGGELPYGRMRNPDVVDHVVKGHRLERPSSCPRDIYEIMEHCWERVSGRIYISAQSLRYDVYVYTIAVKII